MTPPTPGGPVFIGGIAGTGKTRLGAILGRHPSISVTRKTYFWRDLYGRFGDLRVDSNRFACAIAVVESKGFRRLEVEPDRALAEIGALGPTSYGALFGIVHDLHAEAVGKPRWCDQLGLVEAYAGPIFASLPDARMIHMIRDPTSSTRDGDGPWTTGWIMGKWLTSARLAERNERRFPGSYLVIRHEELVADEERILRTVCEFLDEPFDERVAAALQSGSPRASATEAALPRVIARRAEDLLSVHGYRSAGVPAAPARSGRLGREPATTIAFAAWHGLRNRSIRRQLRCVR